MNNICIILIVALLVVWLIYRTGKDSMTNTVTYSQDSQDIFILNVLNGKRNGYYLEVGGAEPIHWSNSYILSKDYNWKGITIEYEKQMKRLWDKKRPNDIIVFSDARNINYLELLQQYNAPRNIDYLQIDLEVDNRSTLDVLEKMDKEIFDYYKFAVITFETDIYINNYRSPFNTREKSREIFKRRGYFLVFPDVSQFEDWYVHPDLVDMDYIYNLVKINKGYINKEQKRFHDKGGLRHATKEIIYP